VVKKRLIVFTAAVVVSPMRFYKSYVNKLRRICAHVRIRHTVQVLRERVRFPKFYLRYSFFLTAFPGNRFRLYTYNSLANTSSFGAI